MAQVDADNNKNVINEINYDYARTSNKGIIQQPENKKINFSRNDG